MEPPHLSVCLTQADVRGLVALSDDSDGRACGEGKNLLVENAFRPERVLDIAMGNGLWWTICGSGKMDMQEHEVISNGLTVWVNSANGMCIGRFSKLGVDVHKDYEAQSNGEGECLDCCHGLPPRESWDRFVSSMREHYQIEVPDDHRPTFVPDAPTFAMG